MELTKGQKLLETIVAKAWDDAVFKQLLISNPLDAIEKLTGERLNIPEGKKLVVRDQTDESSIYINIPVEQSIDDMELTEEELEIVAGGGSLPSPVIQDSADALNDLTGG